MSPTYAVEPVNQVFRRQPAAIHQPPPPDLADRQASWFAILKERTQEERSRTQCVTKGCEGERYRMSVCHGCWLANEKSGKPRWYMACECGNEWIVLGRAASEERRTCSRCRRVSEAGERRG